MNQRLCIVHRDRRDLFEELCREFKSASDVEIFFDRRIGERRRTRAAVPDNRRRTERRHYHSDLRLLGWMLTRRRDSAALPLTEAQPV